MAEYPGILNLTCETLRDADLGDQNSDDDMTDDDTEDGSYFQYELSEPQDDLDFYNAFHENMEEEEISGLLDDKNHPTIDELKAAFYNSDENCASLNLDMTPQGTGDSKEQKGKHMTSKHQYSLFHEILEEKRVNFVSAVDISDKDSAIYGMSVKTNRWYMRIFFGFLIG